MTPPNPEERRKGLLSQVDIDNIVAAMQAGIDPDQHAEHHRLFKQWLQQQEDKRKRREAIKTQVGGWLVIAFLSACGVAAWSWFTSTVAAITKGTQ